jgi:1-aminocyclopropane-1-carboxylate deaminase/D-cysteine desulfhydrase-like pyridoxal-dependent ACC family enzyme
MAQHPAMKLNQTPITSHRFKGIDFYLKRDDLLHPQFSGNKARKFMTLLSEPPPNVHTIISYGSPQANSLYSLAALAQLRGWRCEYYVDRIPSWLQTTPIGNYKAALSLGAHIIAVSQSDTPSLHPVDFIAKSRQPDSGCLVVPEGGRSPLAEIGIKQLASEIIEWVSEQALDNVVIALPSGTGTTAGYLHKHLTPFNIDVITCACVGGNNYLKMQCEQLGLLDLPTLLDLGHKHHFGKLYSEDYQIWLELKAETGVEFDLLYDPTMWRCLVTWKAQHRDRPIIYLHQGGLLGNQSMQARYARKYPNHHP